MTYRRLTGIAGDVVEATQRRLPSQVREPALQVPVCFEPHPNDDILAIEAVALGGIRVGRHTPRTPQNAGKAFAFHGR